MTRGKKKCEILKTIRCQVAKKNGIPYTYTECNYQGECRGTCPKCEEELRYLNRELEKLKQSGKQVAVAGVAAAVITASAAGCSVIPDSGWNVTMGVPAYTQPEELDGDVAYSTPPEETEDIEIAGMMIPPEEETEPPGKGELPEEYVTAGEPLPMMPLIGDVISDLQQSMDVYMGSFERTTVQVEWADWLTESGEHYDIFTVDGQQIIVTYHEDGWGESASLYAGISTEDDQ